MDRYNFEEHISAYIDGELSQEDNLCIQKEAWHQIINPFEEACHIIEIQYGDKTVEEDIEREVI